MAHWLEHRAHEMIAEAQQADPEQGLTRLVIALLSQMKDPGKPCRGHGACMITRQCPYSPACRA